MADEYDLTVLVAEPVEDQFRNRYEFEIRPVLPNPTPTAHSLKTLRLSHQLRSQLAGADLVHSFIAHPYLPAAAGALIGSDVPLTGTALGTYAVHPFSYWIRGRLLKFGYRASSRVFCISAYTRRRIETEAGISHCTVLPLGVDTEQFDRTGARDGDYILSVGAIKRRKGQDVLIRAFARIADEFPDMSLSIVGPVHSQQFKRQLDSLVAEKNLADRVTFVGEIRDRDELADYYRSCRLFALTPRNISDNFEGFGLVYLEAGACGKPSVGTRSGGVPTAVKHGETGLLAPEDDPEAVADAFRTLLEDGERRRRFGENARRHAESLNWDQYVSAISRDWEIITQQSSVPES